MTNKNEVSPDSNQSPKNHRQLVYLVAFSAVILTLYLLSLRFLTAGYIELFLIVSLVAFPIWYFEKEVAMFGRRAMLERVVQSGSWIRRCFWAGHITQFILGFKAIFYALILLAQLNLIKDLHWLVISFDLALFSLLIGPIGQKLSRHIQSDQKGVVMRLWPLLIFNTIFLVSGFLIVDFISLVPDTRDLTANVVMNQASQEYYQSSSNLGGLVTGIFAEVEALMWHYSELIIPNIPSLLLRIIVWAVFLITLGWCSYILTKVLLGVVSLLEIKREKISSIEPIGSFSLSFIYTLIFLAIPYMYLTKLSLDVKSIKIPVGLENIGHLVNPCKENPVVIHQLGTELSEILKTGIERIRVDTDKQVDTLLGGLFPEVEKGVDSYLDWYFSVSGEYQRLAATVGIDMGDKLSEHIFEKTGFKEKLDAGLTKTNDFMTKGMSEIGQSIEQTALEKVRLKPCDFNLNTSQYQALNFDQDKFHFKVAAGTGATVGIVASKLIVQKIGAKVASKVAVKAAVKIAAKKAGAKVAAKGMSSLATTMGAAVLCGPFAVVCGVVAGVATWVATDKAMVEYDEYNLRAPMRADMLAWLGSLRNELAISMKHENATYLEAMAQDIKDPTDKVFSPSTSLRTSKIN